MCFTFKNQFNGGTKWRFREKDRLKKNCTNAEEIYTEKARSQTQTHRAIEAKIISSQLIVELISTFSSFECRTKQERDTDETKTLYRE